MAEHFIPNPENKSEVNHIDGNKQNNYAGNLEWVTPKENIQHAITNNLMNNKGENNKQSILTEKDVKEIIYLLKYTSLTQKEIAKKYNVTYDTVQNIKHKKSWKYLYDKLEGDYLDGSKDIINY